MVAICRRAPNIAPRAENKQLQQEIRRRERSAGEAARAVAPVHECWAAGGRSLRPEMHWCSFQGDRDVRSHGRYLPRAVARGEGHSFVELRRPAESRESRSAATPAPSSETGFRGPAANRREDLDPVTPGILRSFSTMSGAEPFHAASRPALPPLRGRDVEARLFAGCGGFEVPVRRL